MFEKDIFERKTLKSPLLRKNLSKWLLKKDTKEYLILVNTELWIFGYYGNLIFSLI